MKFLGTVLGLYLISVWQQVSATASVSGALFTVHNTLDDSLGNATIFNNLTVGGVLAAPVITTLANSITTLQHNVTSLAAVPAYTLPNSISVSSLTVTGTAKIGSVTGTNTATLSTDASLNLVFPSGATSTNVWNVNNYAGASQLSVSATGVVKTPLQILDTGTGGQVLATTIMSTPINNGPSYIAFIDSTASRNYAVYPASTAYQPLFLVMAPGLQGQVVTIICDFPGASNAIRFATDGAGVYVAGTQATSDTSAQSSNPICTNNIPFTCTFIGGGINSWYCK